MLTLILVVIVDELLNQSMHRKKIHGIIV